MAAVDAPAHVREHARDRRTGAPARAPPSAPPASSCSCAWLISRSAAARSPEATEVSAGACRPSRFRAKACASGPSQPAL